MSQRVPPRRRLSPRDAGLLGAVVSAIIVAVLLALQAAQEADASLGLPIVGSLVGTLTGAAILAKRPGHGIGRLMLSVGMAFVVTRGAIMVVGIDPRGVMSSPVLSVIFIAAEVINNLALIALSVLLIIWFPDGRRTSRLGAIAEVLLLIFVVGMIASTFATEEGSWVGPDVVTALRSAYLVAVLDILWRYHDADALRRTQMRWVLATAAVSVFVMVLHLTVGDTIEILWTIWLFSMLLPAVGVAIALTRYHLYDIDRIISSTVAYGLLTVLLLGVFWIVNLALQAAIQPITGDTPIAIASATLIVAALFNAFRVRFQTIVDRRFHRSRYDAERTVEHFAGRLRGQLDLANLASELRATTIDAVEPVSSAVWIRHVGGAR